MKVRGKVFTALVLPGLHEEVERLERIIVKDYKQDVKTHKDKLMQSHRVRKRIDKIQEDACKLVIALVACCVTAKGSCFTTFGAPP